MHGSKKVWTGIAAAAVVAAIGAPAASADSLAGCSTGSNIQSPNANWVVVTDDLGVPNLVPAALAQGGQACTPAAAQGEPAATATSPSAPASAPLASPYPGWVIVNDDQGVGWLQPAGVAAPLHRVGRAQPMGHRRSHRAYSGSAYVYGGASPSVAQAIQALGSR